MFDGNTGSSFLAASNGQLVTFTPTGGIVYTSSIEVHTASSCQVTINGGSAQSIPDNTWTTIASGSGTINTITFQSGNNTLTTVNAIRVDNKLLINSGTSIADNSFHLPFTDNSTSAALGTDTSGNSNTWTVNLSLIHISEPTRPY